MFRFTIRDVLWLTALVAMGVGWWLDHQRQNALIEQSRLPIPLDKFVPTVGGVKPSM